MLLPALQRVRETANKVACANNLKTIGQGIKLYLVSHGNYFPTGGGDNYGSVIPSPPRGLTSANVPVAGLSQDWGWMYQILPYIEQDNLWKTMINPMLDPNGIFAKVDHPGDLQIATSLVDIYFCPSRRAPGIIVGDNAARAVNDYAGNMGAFTPIFESGTTHDP